MKLNTFSTSLLIGLFALGTLSATSSSAELRESAEPRESEPRELERIIAVVDDNVILDSEFQERIDKVIAQNIDVLRRPPREVIEEQVLEHMIVESIQVQLADRLGIRIDDNELNETLQTIADQNNMNLTEFSAAIAADGMVYSEFRERMRKDMLMSRVRQRQVGARIKITEQDVENFMTSEQGIALLAPDYRLGHIAIAIKDASETALEAAQSQAMTLVTELRDGRDFRQTAREFSVASSAENGGDLGWRTQQQLPSLFAEIIPDMSKGEIANPVRRGQAFHIVALLDTRGDLQHIIPQSRVRHILIKPNAIRSDGDAQQLIADIRQRLINGDSFADLAKTYSDDLVSAREGGELDWINPGETVPEFESAMNNLKLNTISAPVQSPFGWHLIEVLDRRDYDVSEEAREERARKAIYARKFEEEVDSWVNEIRQNAYVELKLTSNEN